MKEVESQLSAKMDKKLEQDIEHLMECIISKGPFAAGDTAKLACWTVPRMVGYIRRLERVVEAAKKLSAVWDDNELIMFARQSESAKNRLELKQALAALERGGGE